MHEFPDTTRREFRSEFNIINESVGASRSALTIVAYPPKKLSLTLAQLAPLLQKSAISIKSGFPRGAVQRRYQERRDYPQALEKNSQEIGWRLFSSGLLIIQFPMEKLDLVKLIWQVALTTNFCNRLFGEFEREYAINLELKSIGGNGFTLSTEYSVMLAGILLEVEEWLNLPKIDTSFIRTVQDKSLKETVELSLDFGDSKVAEALVNKLTMDIANASLIEAPGRATIVEVVKRELTILNDLSRSSGIL